MTGFVQTLALCLGVATLVGQHGAAAVVGRRATGLDGFGNVGFGGFDVPPGAAWLTGATRSPLNFAGTGLGALNFLAAKPRPPLTTPTRI